jgi:hypothetical protein
MSEAELKEFKKTLPYEFSVWKVMQARGVAEFAYSTCSLSLYFTDENEQKLDKPGIYHARHCPHRRKPIKDYKAGFHAFLTRHDAETYMVPWLDYIQEFRARRTWVKTAGEPKDVRAYKQPCVVLSRIEVI